MGKTDSLKNLLVENLLEKKHKARASAQRTVDGSYRANSSLGVSGLHSNAYSIQGNSEENKQEFPMTNAQA